MENDEEVRYDKAYIKRVSYNGSTAVFQTVGGSSILPTRSKQKDVHYGRRRNFFFNSLIFSGSVTIPAPKPLASSSAVTLG